MRHAEILSPYQGTETHPYVATIALAPSEARRFESMAADQPGVVLLGFDRSSVKQWIIYAGCTTKDGRELLESNW